MTATHKEIKDAKPNLCRKCEKKKRRKNRVLLQGRHTKERVRFEIKLRDAGDE